MAFFDNLKNQAMQAARSAGNQAAQNLGQAAKSAAANMGNKTYRVTLSQIPANLAQLRAMPEADLTKPEHTAALTVAALGADGVSEISGIHYIERGYVDLDKMFSALGADIKKED